MLEYSEQQLKALQNISPLVEQIIATLGLSPEAGRLSTEEGYTAWGLMKGSAQVFIFIRPHPHDYHHCSIQVLAPLIPLPHSEAKQLLMFQHLLELNASALSGAAFALKGGSIIIIAERTTRDLDPSEIQEMILKVGYYADLYDDALLSHYHQ